MGALQVRVREPTMQVRSSIMDDIKILKIQVIVLLCLLFIIIVILPIVGECILKNQSKNVNDLCEKLPSEDFQEFPINTTFDNYESIFQSHDFAVMSTFDEVPSNRRLNDPHGEDYAQSHNATENLLKIHNILLTLKDRPIILILIKALLVLLSMLYFFEHLLRTSTNYVLTRDMSSDEEPGTRNATPTSPTPTPPTPTPQRNEPEPNVKVAGETPLTFQGVVDEIKNDNKDVENDNIPLSLDDQLDEYPTTPQADVSSGPGKIEVV